MSGVAADRVFMAGRWVVAIRRFHVRRAGLAVATVVVAAATLVSSLGQFTSLAATPPSSFGAAQLDPYIPGSVTASRQTATTCLVSWTPATQPSPPASLTYEVSDGAGTVLATGVTGTSTTVTVPAATITPMVRARAGSWTSALERTSTTPCAGEPFTPTGVTAPPGDTTTTVSWAPDTGPTATGYTVTATPASGPARSCTATAPTTSCTVTNLSNGLTYTVIVTATNATGTSPASAPVAVTPYPAVMASTANALWLDAAEPSTLFTDTAGTTPAAPGQEVLRWDDRSGNNRHAVKPADAVTGATLTTGALNSRTALRFTSTASEYYDVTGAGIGEVGSNDRTMIVVGRARTHRGTDATEEAAAFAVWPGLHSGLRAEGPAGPGTPINVVASEAYSSSSSNIFVSAATAPDVAHVMTSRDVTDGGQLRNELTLDGGAPATATIASTAWLSYPDLLRIGAAYPQTSSHAWSLDGDIAEVLIFDRALTPTEQRAAESYLARKWGQAITPDAPTGVTPAVTGSTAAVSWTPPEWDGGATITGYTATATPSGAGPVRTCAATPPATNCTLTGLTTGTPYALTVAAANTRGSGTPSTAVPLLTGAPYTASLALWLDAADPSTLFTDTAGTTQAAPGQEVRRWDDRSGNNRHAVTPAAAATGATLTTGALNSRTAMRFTNTASEYYEVTGAGIGAVGSGDRTMLVVGRARTVRSTDATEVAAAFAVWPGDHSGLVAAGAPTPGTPIDRIASEAYSVSGGSAFDASVATPSDIAHVMTSRAVTNGGQLHNELHLDGRAPATATIASTTWLSYPDLLRIGAAYPQTSTYAWSLDGDIAEILIYDRALTPTEQRAAESYLAAKWGHTLAPDVPIAVTGTGGVNQISVTWTAPTDTGGAAVTSYTATAVPTGQSCTVAAPATGCTITGLPSGTYSLSVAATNSAGTGQVSTPSAPVSTLPYPAAPTGITALTNGTRMEVAWTAPSDTGGSPITDYTIQYRVLGDTTWTTAADGVTTNTTTIITSLTPAITHQVRVAAINSSGTGAYPTPVTSAPGQTWTPANLPGGTAVWFDADDPTTLTTTSGAVDQWRDKSGNTRHANQTGTNRPTLTPTLINGRPAVAFDGSNDNLPFDGSFIAVSDYSVAAAVARTDDRLENYYLGGTTTDSNQNLYLGWRTNDLLTHAQWNNDYDSVVAVYTTPTATVVLNSSSASGKAMHVDGALAATSSDGNGLTSWSGSSIGGFLGQSFAGRLGEIVITGGVLAAADRQRLEGYLANKWGTPLAAGHPYANGAPLAP